MGVAAFFVCGVTAFFTHRAAHGLHTDAERSAYVIGEKAAALNGIAQQYLAKQGTGEPTAWKHAFALGYEDGFTNARRER